MLPGTKNSRLHHIRTARFASLLTRPTPTDTPLYHDDTSTRGRNTPNTGCATRSRGGTLPWLFCQLHTTHNHATDDGNHRYHLFPRRWTSEMTSWRFSFVLMFLLSPFLRSALIWNAATPCRTACIVRIETKLCHHGSDSCCSACNQSETQSMKNREPVLKKLLRVHWRICKQWKIWNWQDKLQYSRLLCGLRHRNKVWIF